MIVLLNCSIGWCQKNNHISSTGVLVNLTDTIKNNEDSILVPISALKVANAKMTELKYQRELNNNLYNIIHNDSIIINYLKKDISVNKQLYNNNRFRRGRRPHGDADRGGA